MFIIIVLAFFALVTIGLTVWGVVYKEDDVDSMPRMVPFIGAVIFGVIGSVILLFCSYASVPSRNVAVETAFGKPIDGPLTAGFHWIRPWASTENFSLMIQKSERLGDDCINVKLKGGANACVSAIVRYHTDEKGAINQWRNYGTFDNMKSTLIMSLESDAFNEVLGTYEPLDAQDGANREAIEKALSEKLRTALAKSGVDFDGVSLVKTTFDPNVQKVIDDFVAQSQKTKTAKEAINTADQQRQANAKLQTALTPDLVRQNCLTMVDKLITAGHSLPAGFSCFGPSNSAVPLN